MVPVDSDRVSRAPPYSGTGFESRSFSLTRLSRSMAPLPRGLQLMTGLVTLLLPALQPPLDRDPLGLGCCDFARHYFRNRGFFLFLQVLRWFTSLSSLVLDYVFIEPYAGFTSVGFPIRTSPVQRLLAPHRGLSQLATSFIAIFCQGIHHAPLVT
jgi:hypothetical protein